MAAASTAAIMGAQHKTRMSQPAMRQSRLSARSVHSLTPQVWVTEPQEQFGTASKTPSRGKASSRKWSELGLLELQAAIQQLAAEEEGLLSLSRLQLLLATTLDPPLAEEEIEKILSPLTDGNRPLEEVTVTVEDLLNALKTGPGAKLMAQRTKDLTATVVERSALVESVSGFTDRNDALMALPFTLTYIIIFVFLVIGHLHVLERHHLENALEAWVNGRDPRTSAMENVDSLQAFWEWLLGDEDGLAGFFLDQRSNDSNMTQYALANRNILLGDVKMTRWREDGEQEKVWLIHSPPGQWYLEESRKPNMTDDYFGAATAAARHLLEVEQWSNPDTLGMDMVFSTYNEMAAMFALTRVNVDFTRTGEVNTVINTDALSITPYPSSEPQTYAFDGLYLLLIFYTAFMELRDLCAALRLGCGEYWDYWGFWNVVDWLCIVLGLTNAVIWVFCCLSMTDSTLQSLLDGTKLNVDPMSLDEGSLDAILDRLAALREMYFALHIVMALNTISIVMKFFRAFTSNHRLRVVTDTFSRALEDFAHFGIIFVTIFVSFAIIGHVLFGNDMEEFNSMTGSINTGLQVMMGEFPWYADVTMLANKGSGKLPSGMPVHFLTLWYVLYMFLVLLVLLNMLLAIIIEHYTQVRNNLDMMSHGDNPTIWAQVGRWVRFKRETRNFIPLEELQRGLENDNDMTHPKEEVTCESLLEAWPQMSKRQALWLLRYVRTEKEKKVAAPQVSNDDLKQILDSHGEQLEALSDRLHRVSEALRTERTERTERTARQQPPQDSPTLLKISDRVDGIIESMSKIRRDQAGLARRIEDIALGPRQQLTPREAKRPQREGAEPPVQAAGRDGDIEKEDDAKPAEKERDGGRPRRQSASAPAKARNKNAPREPERGPDRDRQHRREPERSKEPGGIPKE